jgi:hypothetical protein
MLWWHRSTKADLAPSWGRGALHRKEKEIFRCYERTSISHFYPFRGGWQLLFQGGTPAFLKMLWKPAGQARFPLIGFVGNAGVGRTTGRRWKNLFSVSENRIVDSIVMGEGNVGIS